MYRADFADNYTLILIFNNGEKRLFDVKPYLKKGIFKQLQKLELFNSVKAYNGTIQWSNEADLCPDTLYLNSNPVGE
jgi:hypothetical protein